MLLARWLGPESFGNMAFLLGTFLGIRQLLDMGQIGGAMLLATERVSLRVVTGIIFMIASMGVTYLALAPVDAIVPGLGLASEGLALKMVAMQLIQINIVAYIISRIWKWPFDWVYQPVGLLGCIGFGWSAHFTVTNLMSQDSSLIISMGLGGALYLILMAAFVYTMPWLTGLTRDELILDVRRIPQDIMNGIRTSQKH